MRTQLLFCAMLLGAVPTQAATLTVAGTGDAIAADGTLTLREALASLRDGNDVNADAAAARTGGYGVADQVSFAIGTGVATIAVQSPLPVVAQPVRIDATTQPGAEPLPRVVVNGLAAGAATAGLVLAPGSALDGIDVAAFGGHGVHVVPTLFGNGFETGTPAPVTPDAPVVILQATARQNGGDGIRVEEGARVMLDDTRSAENAGRGLLVRGALTSESATFEDNGSHGVEIDSAATVRFDACSVSGNGTATQGVGVRVLRASFPDTFDELDRLVIGGVRVATCTVSGNTGDGIALGHAADQTGTIRARLDQNQVFGNAVGIRVAERDATTHPTVTEITFNNVFDNRDGGVHLSSSHQMPDFRVPIVFDVAPFAGNSVHHNAIDSPGCSGTQTASQVVVDGPLVVDPAHAAACGAAGIDTESECTRLADPEDVLSGGVGNACVWTGVQCMPAWDLSGRAGTGECGSSDNRLFAYVNNPVVAQVTQKGLAALNGAIVSARRNTWGVGGPDNGTFADGMSRIDFDAACAAISTCP